MSDTATAYLRAELLERADVRVERRHGWVTNKRTDDIVGLVTRGENAAGQAIWRASAGDVQSFAFTHAGAVETVIALHNMQAKARAYDLLIHRLDGSRS